MSFDVVTGAYGQTGHAIAGILAHQGRNVRTLTRAQASSGAPYPVLAPTFDDPAALTAALQGCEVLYSTYWARYGVQGDFAPLVSNARILYDCAREAGVRRIVQVTVARAREGAGLPYFEGKASLEDALRSCGVPSAVVAPALLFGPDDTLVNNAAWAMRNLHAIPVPGGGSSLVRPAFVDDVARLAIAQGAASGQTHVDALGPETYTYRGLMEAIRAAIGARALMVRVPWILAAAATRPVGWFLGDVPLTRNEVRAVRRGLFHAEGPTTCPTAFSAWLQANAANLGRRYHAQRRRDQARTYPHLRNRQVR